LNGFGQKQCSVMRVIDMEVLPNDSIVLSKPIKINAEGLAVAAETFGDPQKAERWLQAHHLILGMSPADYLENGGNKGDVLRILHSISYGGVA
jgi:hypothetical protein